MRDGYWLQAHSGKIISLLNPEPEDILLTDIAHALSNLCRFGGHSDFYSVAQHSVLVSKIVSPPNSLWALFHDAPEAYICDIPTPLKRYLNGRYTQLESIWMAVICQRFELPLEEPKEVKRADGIMLATERRDLVLGQEEDWGVRQIPLAERIIPMIPRHAKWAFIERFLEIEGRGLV